MAERVRFTLAALAMAMALPAHAASGDKPAWSGVYTYHGQDGYDGGGTAATGSPIVLDMTLQLSAAGGCKLQAQGFQTAFTSDCLVSQRASDKGIDVAFLKSPPDAVETSSFFPANYKPGTILFSLVPDATAGRVVTVWGALKPDMVHTERGEYFARSAGKP